MQQKLFDFIEKYIPLTNEEKEILISMDTFRTVKKGTVLLKRGQYSKEGYFVLQGCLRTYYIIEGEEKTTAFYTELEGITPHSVLTNKASEYYIAATEDSIITVSNPEMEAEMFAKFPKFESLCRIMSEELLSKQQLNLDDFKTSTPEQRYLNILKNKPSLIQRVPQHQLASFLGIKPESLSRIKSRILQKNKK